MQRITNEEFLLKIMDGFQIRVSYKKPFEDGLGGYWTEELYMYDKESDKIRCYYPKSSYEEDYFTECSIITSNSLVYDINNDIENDNVLNLSIEDKGKALLKKKIMEKLDTMSEEELQELLDR